MNTGRKMVGTVLGRENGTVLTPAENSVTKVCSAALPPILSKSKGNFNTTSLMVK